MSRWLPTLSARAVSTNVLLDMLGASGEGINRDND